MQKLSQLILKLFGWKIVGHLPDLKKYILIVAPHTSNWDAIVGLLSRFAVGVKINFLVKHQLFFFPMNILLKVVGGMPVNRSVVGNVVQQIADLYNSKEELRLAIAPEGTRGKVNRWKEGFYHIAARANVPIVMIGLDYATKELRIEKPFFASGDIASDFDTILDYFRTINGLYPKEIPDYVPKE